MKHIVDIIGIRFGRLIVIRKSGKTKTRSWKYLCKCDCGRTTDKPTHANLVRGHTKSCGCLKAENVKTNQVTGSKHHQWTGRGEISGAMFNNIKIRAKVKKLDFSITIDDMYNQWINQNGLCALTGTKLEFAATQKDAKNGKTTASLDRIDSDKGYIVGNIQWVHKIVNWMKLDFTQQEFIEWCGRITKYNETLKN